jgi:undecaprenyl diphosphate synthase
VSFLLGLFMRSLEQEIAKLHENGIRFRIIGDPSPFESRLQKLISDATALTAGNRRLTLTVAVNYGGRWDLLQAMQAMLAARPELATAGFGENDLAPYLSLADAPEPDLFIRTGGEQRVSNFLLWQLAYTELYFTELPWPEFDATALDAAIASFQRRERRFGRTSEQLLAGAVPRTRALTAAEGSLD